MSSTDKEFITSLINLLSSPLSPTSNPNTSTKLLSKLNSNHKTALKSKFTSTSIKATLSQLEELREIELGKKERRERGSRKGKGVVRVSASRKREGEGEERDCDWVEDLPKEWVRNSERELEDGEEEDRLRYSEALARVKDLRNRKSIAEQQVLHYKKLESLTSKLTPKLIQDHLLSNPDSSLSQSISKLEEILPLAVQALEDKPIETPVRKKRKKDA